MSSSHTQPVGLLSVLPTLFIVGANTFVTKPAMAWTIAVIVTALLFIAAVVAIGVCTLVFPEYCVDEVRAGQEAGHVLAVLEGFA